MELWGNGNPSGFDPENEGSTPSGSAHSGESRFFNAQKGGQTMKCEHKRIKSENCVISCVDCGEILPLEFLTGKKSSAPKTPAETPEKAVKTKPTRKKVAK